MNASFYPRSWFTIYDLTLVGSQVLAEAGLKGHPSYSTSCWDQEEQRCRHCLRMHHPRQGKPSKRPSHLEAAPVPAPYIDLCPKLPLSQISAPGDTSAWWGLSVWGSVNHKAGRQGLSLIWANNQNALFWFWWKKLVTPCYKGFCGFFHSCLLLYSERLFPHNNTHQILLTSFLGMLYTFSRRLLWTECVCHLKVHIETLSSNVVLFGDGTLRINCALEVTSSWINALLRRGRKDEVPSLPLPTCEEIKEPSSELSHKVHWFQPSQTLELWAYFPVFQAIQSPTFLLKQLKTESNKVALRKELVVDLCGALRPCSCQDPLSTPSRPGFPPGKLAAISAAKLPMATGSGQTGWEEWEGPSVWEENQEEPKRIRSLCLSS